MPTALAEWHIELENIMHRRNLTLALAVMMGAVWAPAAIGATPTGAYAQFKYCPYTDTNVGSCLYSVTSSGSFKIGSTTLPIDKPIVLQGGVESLGLSPLYDAVGAPTLAAPPGKVPGGLLGIMNPRSDWPYPLWLAFWSIVGTANDVTATMELVQQGQATLSNALYPPNDGVNDNTALRLAVRVRLQNPFLGNNCYIGTPQNPIIINLQTGTTSPPLPNQPISGDPGTTQIVWTDEPNYIGYLQTSGATFVDNSFSVPAASGCGNIALGLPIVTQVLDALVSGAVNLKVGLPSAGGKNTAIMNSEAAIAAAQYVLASEQ